MLFTSEVKPHSKFGLELTGLPSQYSFVSDDVDIETPPAKKIEAMVQSSLPGARLVGLQRFANRKLWRAYVARRDEVADENAGDPDVKLLFHGTKDLTKILGTGLQTNSEGFDFRHCRGGEYGIGSYFATCAAYPVKIHPKHVNEDGTFTFILAEVACGACKNLGDKVDPTLQVPPEISHGKRFHSVRGTENGVGTRHGQDFDHGEQFVIYDKAQAYPHFVCEIKLPYLIGKYKIKLVNQSASGQYLTAHGFGGKDQRNDHSSYAIVHKPGSGWEGEWELEHVRDSVYKIKLTNHEPRGRYLTAHNSSYGSIEDQRNDHSSYAIVHKPGSGWEGEWELEHVRDSVYKIKLTNQDPHGQYLTAHNSIDKDKRNDHSSYAFVVEPRLRGWEGEWELERI